MDEDYPIHVLPQDATIAVEALAQYAQTAVEEGRGEDARRAFAAAGAIASQIEDSMFDYSASGENSKG